MKIGSLEVFGVIYKITNKINKKVYIGQTVNGFKGRYGNNLKRNTKNIYLKRSIEKYGVENFEICEIFDIAFSRNELNVKESTWIAIYNSTNKENGYNLISAFGYDYNEEYSEIMRSVQKSKPIVQLDFDGNLINVWNYGGREASKKLKYDQAVIWRCCNKKQFSYKNNIWLYADDYYKNGVDLYWHESNSRSKRVAQIDFEGNIVKIWTNIQQIHNVMEIDNSCISKCCLGKIKHCYGSKWFYYCDVKKNNEYSQDFLFGGAKASALFEIYEEGKGINGSFNILAN